MQLQVDMRRYAKATPLQRADLEDRRASLYRRIQRLRESQAQLMPELRVRLGISEEDFTGRRAHAETIPLHLPSSIPPETRPTVCSATLLTAERHLREAEAFDALESLRNRLRTKTFMTRYKTSNITGQRGNTRARNLLAAVDLRIFLVKHRYRRARAALLNLVGAEEWQRQGFGSKLQELADEDVRGLGDAALKTAERASVDFARQRADAGLANLQNLRTLKAHTESSRTLSWIWTSVHLEEDGSDPGLNDGKLHWILYRLTACLHLFYSRPCRVGEGQSSCRTLDRGGSVGI